MKKSGAKQKRKASFRGGTARNSWRSLVKVHSGALVEVITATQAACCENQALA